LVGLNHFTVPLAIHVVSGGKSNNKTNRPVPAHPGMFARRKITQIASRLVAQSSRAILAETRRFAALLRPFVYFPFIPVEKIGQSWRVSGIWRGGGSASRRSRSARVDVDDALAIAERRHRQVMIRPQRPDRC
jgi:hypothetical protein